jgi:hypothetical protein
MQRTRQQLPLFPADGALQVPLTNETLASAEELLMELLIAVFEATREGNPTTEGNHHGKNHDGSPST